MEGSDECRVLSIQSHVVSGYVGNKSAAFPLQILGFEVDTINSVQFSNHTGYGAFRGQVLNAADLSDIYTGLKVNGLNRYSHLLTGYIGSKSFLLEVRQVIQELKAINSDLVYVCDPVMGDNGKLYVPEELLPVYRESIIPFADILTPNQFEAELLTGIQITDLTSAKAAIQRLHELGAKTVVISSTELGTDKFLVQLASSMTANGEMEVIRVDIPKFDFAFTGTGDLFAALLLAWMHRYPSDIKLACETVVSTMQAVLRRTVEHSRAVAKGSKPTMAQCELRLIQSKTDIERPLISVTAVSLKSGINGTVDATPVGKPVAPVEANNCTGIIH